MTSALRARYAPLGLFLAAYAGHAAALWTLPPSRPAGRVLAIGTLALMVAAVIWARRRQDEVLRGVAARATEAGFWAGFAALYLASLYPDRLAGWPLWTAPLAVWVVAYGWNLLRLR